MKRNSISRSDRIAILKRHGDKCTLCGATEPLELARGVPLTASDRGADDDIIPLCSNCHQKVDSGSSRGIEYEMFLESLLLSSPQFSNVQRDARIESSRYRPDLSASENGVDLFIECKAVFALVGGRFEEAISQLEKYPKSDENRRIILATLSELTEEQNLKLKDKDFEHWGPQYIASSFREKIANMPESFIGNLIKSSVDRSKNEDSESFKNKLKNCEPGKSQWSDYQNLVGGILEALFTPPLEKTIIESSDEFKINRRDFVLPNYCTDGFWDFMRQQYAADYIVVDAKNYVKPIKKNEILQISNYLKVHGAGLFAIIFSRHGAARSAQLTMREQWIVHSKLIVVLNDDDVFSMLSAVESGGNPDTVIRQKIEEFRLKM